MLMQSNQTELARSYLAMLKRHIKSSSALSLKSARRLGTQALKIGIETLDLARIHEESLLSIHAPDETASFNHDVIRRAADFFAEAITPIEATHRGALDGNARLKAMVEELRQRTLSLAASNQELKEEIVQRKAVEISLRQSEITTSEMLSKSRQMQEELRSLSRELLSAQEAERRKISRELHDVIAQTLAGINIRLSQLKIQSSSNTKDFSKKIAVTQQQVEKSVEIVHRFARDLRPSVLDDLGLIPALQTYLNGFIEDTGIRVTLQANSTIEKLSSTSRTTLFRVAQESLTNVAKHSKASHAKISIQTHDKSMVRMEIRDNGHGFEVSGMPAKKHRQCLGLIGMRERVEMLGGHFCVESAPGRATTIRVDIPQHSNGAHSRRAINSASESTLHCS